MTLAEYLYNKKISPVTKRLIEKLQLYWENDEEFVIGVLCDLKTDEERQLLCDYIDQGKDVSYENIILFALDLKLQRNKQNK